MSESIQQGYNYALSLLSRQSYTIMKLGKKLTEKGFAEDKKDIIEKLKQRGLLDDKLYALRFIETKDQTAPFGEYVVRQKLKEKGIHPDILNTVFSLLIRNEDDLALKLMHKKYKFRTPEKESALRFLASRGFKYSSALYAYGTFIADQQDDIYK